MSADNWRECPECLRKAMADIAEQRREVNAAYGKVSSDEYHRMLEELPPIPPEVNLTLCEDYAIGTGTGGEFGVDYRCYCQQCGFKFEFKHKEQALKEED